MARPRAESQAAREASATPSYDQLLYALQMAPPIRYVPERQYEVFYRDYVVPALNGTLKVPSANG
jgi:hypothetical protein